MPNFLLSAVSIAVIVLAWYFNWIQQQEHTATTTPGESAKPPQPEESSRTTTNLFIGTTIYAIGDLHGDVTCAKEWVERTGLLETSATNGVESWRNNSTHLVFLGDYIDKGVTSKQTVEFVKSLTDRFPEQVTAILGNHEIELLRDRSAQIWADGAAGYYQLVYGAVHPAEYLNYLENEPDEDDQRVVDALYNASLRVYAGGKYRSVYMIPDPDFDGSILEYVDPGERELVKERLKVYQTAYLDAFRSNTVLGTWLEERPIATVIDSTLFVHGGFHPQAVQYLPDVASINVLNAAFAQHASEDKFADFLRESTPGQLVYNFVTYRGNHKIGTSCDQLILPKDIHRLAVGHTPGPSVRSLCNKRFLALDSSLSRWFRNSGNQYCHGNAEHAAGQFRCMRKVERCEGQIVRIQGEEVEVLSMDST